VSTETISAVWYENKYLLILSFLFLPLAIYGLYKSETIDKQWKIKAVVIYLIVLIFYAAVSEEEDTSLDYQPDPLFFPG